MTRWEPFVDILEKAGGRLFTQPEQLADAPLPEDPWRRAFLTGWPSQRSAGFMNGWGADPGRRGLDDVERALWEQHYGAFTRVLDAAGEWGVLFLPDAKTKSWWWYFAFAFPTFRERPCGRLLIQPPCSPEALEGFEGRLGQRLPPIARTFYRVMGAVHFSGDISQRDGILGLAPSHLGRLGDPAEAPLGRADWMPWKDLQPLVCIGFLSRPDELWLTKNHGDKLFLAGHDPGEVQEYMADLAAYLDDSLFQVDESRWQAASPAELQQLAAAARREGAYDKAIGFYRANAETYLNENDLAGHYSSRVQLAATLKEAGRNEEALAAAQAVLNKLALLGKLKPRLCLVLMDGIKTACEVLLHKGEAVQAASLARNAAARPELMKNDRWRLSAWLLKALLQQADRDSFMLEWQALTTDIYQQRQQKFHPVEPPLGPLVEQAAARGWNVEFTAKSKP